MKPSSDGTHFQAFRQPVRTSPEYCAPWGLAANPVGLAVLPLVVMVRQRIANLLVINVRGPGLPLLAPAKQGHDPGPRAASRVAS